MYGVVLCLFMLNCVVPYWHYLSQNNGFVLHSLPIRALPIIVVQCSAVQCSGCTDLAQFKPLDWKQLVGHEGVLVRFLQHVCNNS